VNARFTATVAMLALSLGGLLSAQNKAVDAEHGTKMGKLAQLQNAGRFLFADGVWRPDNPTEKGEKLDSVTRLECYMSGRERDRWQPSILYGGDWDDHIREYSQRMVTYYSVVSWDAGRVIASDSPTTAFPICLSTQITINLHDQSIMATDTRKLWSTNFGRIDWSCILFRQNAMTAQ